MEIFAIFFTEMFIEKPSMFHITFVQIGVFDWLSGRQKASIFIKMFNQRTNGPVNAHLIPWHTKAQNVQNLENI